MKKLRAGLVLVKDTIWLALRRWQALAIQGGGLLLAGLVFSALLNVPESHVWDVAISAMGWPALVVGTLWLQVVVFRRMRLASPRVRLVFALPLLLVWISIWATLWLYLAKTADNFTVYASYLNSRLPAPGRAILTYQRIAGVIEDLYVIVQWWLLPGLLLPCIVETVTSGVRWSNWQRISNVWRGWVWWVALIVAKWIASVSTKCLLVWKPHQSAALEMLSVMGRSLAIYSVDIVLWYLLLALLVTYLLTTTDAGTPEISQPRTAGKP
jgi:hypothetical protein